MRYFTKKWYREMQVAGFLVFPKTEEGWEEEIAYYKEEGIDYQKNFKQNLEDMKDDLLKFLPDFFHPYILNGTINSKYPSLELREMAEQWQKEYEKRVNNLWEDYDRKL